jgi:hypothetical protein
MRRSAVAIAAALIAATASGTAQDPLVGRVLLAAVTDGRDRPIVALEADHFVVHEDGQQREILSVRVADYPLVLLLDNTSHAAGDFEAMRAAVLRFVTRVGDRAVGVVTMADPPAVVAGVEAGRSSVLSDIEALQVAAAGGRRPLQALSEAARLVQATGSSFAAVIVVSVTPSVPVDPEPRGLVTAFVESGDILHLVTRAPTASPGAASPIAPEDLLRDLATRSGGQTTAIYSPVSFQAALDQIADRLASEMLVEYLAPTDAQAPADVRVGVAIPGAKVRGLGVLR